jgi:signal transduction histidine kinase
MQALLDDLRDFNRSRFGMGIKITPTFVDAGLVIAEELDLLRAAYPARQLALSVTGDTRGMWDGMRLRQVVNNLVENAVKYGSQETAVEVVVSGDGSQLVIEVKNRGFAIEPSELKGIFDPLRRSLARDERADSANSLGLGLYIVRQIVEGHQGECVARSEQSTTVFTVRLPQRFPPDTRAGPRAALESSSPESRRSTASPTRSA